MPAKNLTTLLVDLDHQHNEQNGVDDGGGGTVREHCSNTDQTFSTSTNGNASDQNDEPSEELSQSKHKQPKTDSDHGDHRSRPPFERRSSCHQQANGQSIPCQSPPAHHSMSLYSIDSKPAADPDTHTNKPICSEKEYIERIIKLQMDNLIPLKEDVSDWLNRILNVTDIITVDNFMDRLDNGVLVCKLAKLIEDQCNLTGGYCRPGDRKNVPFPLTSTGKIKTFHNQRFPVSQHQKNRKKENEEELIPIVSVADNSNHDHSSKPTLSSLSSFSSSSSSSSSSTSSSLSDQHQTPMKCWENAKSRSFFARDNVSNFLDWCRKLGVKDAVLFETEDLVSHVNQRNVVLCLLEVARIACTKHSFSPAPGLVEFEQEIEREIQNELKQQQQQQQQQQHDRFESSEQRHLLDLLGNNHIQLNTIDELQDNPHSKHNNVNHRRNASVRRSLWPDNEQSDDQVDSQSSTTRQTFSSSQLVIGKNQGKLAYDVEANLHSIQSQLNDYPSKLEENDSGSSSPKANLEHGESNLIKHKDGLLDELPLLKLVHDIKEEEEGEEEKDLADRTVVQNVHEDDNEDEEEERTLVLLNNNNSSSSSSSSTSNHLHRHLDSQASDFIGEDVESKDCGFVDDGESCSSNSDIIRRSPSTNSVISSASSTYLDNNGSSTTSSTPTPMTSELDHKVMQIAKTYYGKEARSGVQRLSEGKYKIANRIVFVRLLKARHVMVRVGGGWTTLSHFLARHGGDPNQQILPDELLPLDTKATSVCPRKRSSSTHTLVISGTPQPPHHRHHQHQQTHHASLASTPDILPTNVTSGRHSATPFSRYSHSSTPTSRRSSISSPEPSIGALSSSSGYSSTGGGGGGGGVASHQSSYGRPLAGAGSVTKIPVLLQQQSSQQQQQHHHYPRPRRQRLPSLQTSEWRFGSNGKLSSERSKLPSLFRGSLPRSTSSSVIGGSEHVDLNGNTSIPRSTTSVDGQSLRIRYPNYLHSSQHITGRLATSTSSTVLNRAGRDSPPTTVSITSNGNAAKGNGAAMKYTPLAPIRKAAQKTC